jgi:hypothetical protein
MVPRMEEPRTSNFRGTEPEAARLSAPAIVSGRIVDIGGFPILLRAGDLAHAEAMAALLGTCHACAGPSELSIGFGARAPKVPPRPPDESYGDVRLWRDGEVLYLSHAGNLTARATPRSIDAGATAGDFRAGFHSIFPYAITHALAFKECFVLHAATIVRDNRVVLVLANSGKGKSTLVLAASQHGWDALGDDLAVLRRAAGGFEVAGIHRPLTVPADVAGALVDPSPNDYRRRMLVEACKWQSGWHPLACCLAVEHGQIPEGELRTVSGGELFELALGAFAGLGQPEFVRKILPVAAALTGFPSWELRHSPNPAQRLAVAGRLLDEVWLAASGAPAEDVRPRL